MGEVLTRAISVLEKYLTIFGMMLIELTVLAVELLAVECLVLQSYEWQYHCYLVCCANQKRNLVLYLFDVSLQPELGIRFHLKLKTLHRESLVDYMGKFPWL